MLVRTLSSHIILPSLSHHCQTLRLDGKLFLAPLRDDIEVSLYFFLVLRRILTQDIEGR